jgi:GMP synthase (glutamine-hydrolysing)
MKPVFVLRHVPHEGLGTLETFLTEGGLEAHHVELYRPSLKPPDLKAASALIVMGGPMNVDEVDQYPFLGVEVGWIRQAVTANLPVLGICLGAQLLAKSLGARVYPNGVKEIGWYQLELTPPSADDRLFAGLGPTATVFQWHGDTFDLPPGAVHLGRTRLCQHQAFRYGPSAYGLQFHVEMTPEMIDCWLDEPGNGCELAGLDYIDPRAIRAQTPQFLPAMQKLGQRVLRRFVEMCKEKMS